MSRTESRVKKLLLSLVPRNPKTTAFGIASAGAAFVFMHPQYFSPVAVDVASFVIAGGLAGMGLAGKDHNVSGSGKDIGEEVTAKRKAAPAGDA